jgi:hypothetical protein
MEEGRIAAFYMAEKNVHERCIIDARGSHTATLQNVRSVEVGKFQAIKNNLSV